MVKIINAIKMRKIKLYTLFVVLTLLSCGKKKPVLVDNQAQIEEVKQDNFKNELTTNKESSITKIKESISIEQLLNSTSLKGVNDTIYWQTGNKFFQTSSKNEKEKLYTVVLDKKDVMYKGEELTVVLSKTYYTEIKGRYVYPFINLAIIEKKSDKILTSKVIARTGENGITPKFKIFNCEELQYGIVLFMHNNYSGEFITDTSIWGVSDLGISELLLLSKTYYDTSAMVPDKSSNHYVIKNSEIKFGDCHLTHTIDLTDNTGNSKRVDHYSYDRMVNKFIKK